MNELPSMIFSSDARLLSEHLVLTNMPRLDGRDELEKAFFSSLTREEDAVFARFCSSNVGRFRIFRLINFYPYHFAFGEKCRVEGEIKNIVFLAEDTASLHSLMSPSSESLRDIGNSLICELSDQNEQSGKPIFPTPESLLALSHIPSFTAMLHSNAEKPVYCDLHKLINCICRSFSRVGFYSDIKFDYTENCSTDAIVELPLTHFVYVLSAAFAVLYAISNDRTIRIGTRKFSYAGEITLTAGTAHAERLPFNCTDLCDISSVFPSISRVAQSADMISIFSNLILSVDVDRELDTVTVTLGAGFDYQSEPDFKFSDPYSDIDRLVKGALDVFDNIK